LTTRDRPRAFRGHRKPTGPTAPPQSSNRTRIRNGDDATIQDKDAFKDNYVFFGFTAPGLFDLRSAPVGGVYPGVEITATVLDNLLSGDFLRDAPPWQTILVVTLMAVGSGALIFWVRRPKTIVMVATASFCLPVVLSLAYAKAWRLLWQETAAASCISIAIMISYAIEGRQKRFIKNAFQQYLSRR
jgi:adenylate cyclase